MDICPKITIFVESNLKIYRLLWTNLYNVYVIYYITYRQQGDEEMTDLFTYPEAKSVVVCGDIHGDFKGVVF